MTKNIPSLYDFNGHSIRVVEIDSAPWFVAADVCKVLTVGNTTDATSNLDQIEVRNLPRQGPYHHPLIVPKIMTRKMKPPMLAPA